MSIYSGFATRQQQQFYNENIYSILYILQKRIIKFFKNQPANDIKFIDLVLKIDTTLKNMEDSKYLQPKISNSFNELIQYLRVKKNQNGHETSKDNAKNQVIVSKQSITLQNRKKTQKNRLSIESGQKNKQIINVTERIAQIAEKNDTKNNLIKKRIVSNKTQRITANNFTISDTQLLNGHQTQKNEGLVKNQIRKKSREEQKPQQIRQLPVGLKNMRRQNKNHTSLNQIKVEQKSQEKEDVRQMIKGYLVKKRKNYGKEHYRHKNQIQQIFQY